MKIIATTSGGYLCEISSTELREFSETHNFGIGTEIPVKMAAESISMLRSLDSIRIENAIDKAKQALNSLNKIKDDVDALLLFDKLKGDYNNA
jgi:hypothetical protein